MYRTTFTTSTRQHMSWSTQIDDYMYNGCFDVFFLQVRLGPALLTHATCTTMRLRLRICFCPAA
jgi:hypothetical protein